MEVAEQSWESIPHRDIQSKTRRTRRTRLLYTCAVTLLQVAHKAYKRAEGLSGPMGCLASKLSSISNPFIGIIRYQCLAVLSFIDDRILNVETMIETLFPPSSHLFNAVDHLLCLSENLPNKFDYVVNEWATSSEGPLNWASTKLNETLDLFQCTLSEWGLGGAKEKDIIVVDEQRDVSPNDTSTAEAQSEDNGHVEATEEKSETMKRSTIQENEDLKQVENACKDILDQLQQVGLIEEIVVGHTEKHQEAQRGGNKCNGSVIVRLKGDPIEELFDSGWGI